MATTDSFHILLTPFLGVITELQKATISFFMSVRLSVRMEQFCSHWTDFYEILYLRIFSKIGRQNSSFLRRDKKNGHFTWRSVYVYDNISRILLRMTKFADKYCKENEINTHFMFNNIFPKNRAICEIMWKNVVARLTTDCNNMRRRKEALYMQDN